MCDITRGQLSIDFVHRFLPLFILYWISIILLIYFPIARNHWVLIEMIPHPEALIKVSRNNARNFNLENTLHFQFNSIHLFSQI